VDGPDPCPTLGTQVHIQSTVGLHAEGELTFRAHTQPKKL